MSPEYMYSGSPDAAASEFTRLANAHTLAFDIEASGVDIIDDIPYGFSITHRPDQSFYASADNDIFIELLADPSRLLIAHNAKYDRAMAIKLGVIADNLCDTMIAAHLLEDVGLSLKELVFFHLGRRITSFDELTKPFNDMTFEEQAQYSCAHAMHTLALWQHQEPEMKKLGLLRPFWDIEMPLVPVLCDKEMNGILVDTPKLVSLGQEFDVRLDSLTDDLGLLAGVPGMNHNSGTQVAKLLYDQFGFPVGRTTSTGKRSVDKRYIETIQHLHPYIGLYLAYKELRTLRDSYVKGLRKATRDNGRIYGSFNQTNTGTGRLSSSNPNLQKIPKRSKLGKLIRGVFIAPPGHVLVKPDYDLLELKMMAHQSQDSALLLAFREERDIHTETAIKLYGSADFRFKGKTANFQIINSGGDRRTRKALEEAYPEVFAWTRKMNRYHRETGYATTLGGRIRSISELDHGHSEKMLEHGERMAMSTRIQGSSAEVVKKGMVRAWKALRGSSAKMLLQVHDELVFEVPIADANDLIQVLYSELEDHELSLPMTVSVEVGQNWGDMKEVKKGETYVHGA